jgi:hypothetical protein
VIGWNRFGDEIYFVIARPNASPFQVPVWMTEPRAAGMTVLESPRIDLGALRNLRRLLDATLPSSDARSLIDREDDDEKDARTSAESVQHAGGRDRQRLPRNIQTAPLKPLLQSLLADLIAAQRPVPAPPSRTDEVDA